MVCFFACKPDHAGTLTLNLRNSFCLASRLPFFDFHRFHLFSVFLLKVRNCLYMEET